MTYKRKVTLSLVLALVTLLLVNGLCFGAEQFPTKPIQVIVPYTAGGSNDLLARAVEKIWPKYSLQPMIIVNKPGSGGVMGTEYLVRSNPDGYTILNGYGSGVDLVLPHLQKLPYDPFKDLVAVARLSIHSVVLCVSAKSPFKSMKDVIDWANKGNRVTAAVSVAGGSMDITLRAISKRANIPITTVPFAGGSESVAAASRMTHDAAERAEEKASRDAVIAEAVAAVAKATQETLLASTIGQRTQRHWIIERILPFVIPLVTAAAAWILAKS